MERSLSERRNTRVSGRSRDPFITTDSVKTSLAKDYHHESAEVSNETISSAVPLDDGIRDTRGNEYRDTSIKKKNPSRDFKSDAETSSKNKREVVSSSVAVMSNEKRYQDGNHKQNESSMKKLVQQNESSEKPPSSLPAINDTKGFVSENVKSFTGIPLSGPSTAIADKKKGMAKTDEQVILASKMGSNRPQEGLKEDDKLSSAKKIGQQERNARTSDKRSKEVKVISGVDNKNRSNDRESKLSRSMSRQRSLSSRRNQVKDKSEKSDKENPNKFASGITQVSNPKIVVTTILPGME
jgi:hypothetical protein